MTMDDLLSEFHAVEVHETVVEAPMDLAVFRKGGFFLLEDNGPRQGRSFGRRLHRMLVSRR